MDCCSVKNNEVLNNVCFVCKSKSKSVSYKTILMILTFEQLKRSKESKYFYCSNPNCNVVYFSNELELVYNKNDVRLKIGIKETKKSKLICYCFDITEKQIKDELKLIGKSTIPNFITEKIKHKLCACNIKNPSGKCCLGDVKNIIKLNIK